VLLHRLLLLGVLQRDLQSCTRAVHLLEACVEAGCEPKVGGVCVWFGRRACGRL
jgi:hypothetical protein